jgi:hypothetical protein
MSILTPDLIPMDLLKQSIVSAIDELYKKDKYLIAYKPIDAKNDKHVSERSVVFRIGVYLEKYLHSDKRLHGYKLDVEYNRKGYGKKTLPCSPNGTYPDLIIHKRGKQDYNLIVIEFKTWWNRNNSQDIEKLRGFTKQSGKYKYRYGLSVILEKEKEKNGYICFQNGCKVKCNFVARS